MNVGDFIYKSKNLSKIKGHYANPDEFLQAYKKFSIVERKSLVMHFIMDNSPFAFMAVYEKPLIFEQVRQYISHILDVDVNHIKLIGSTKTGFRMGIKDYGAPYSKASDLDFMIIDEGLFLTLAGEFAEWKKAYQKEGVLNPRGDFERRCWDENMRILPTTIGLGFVDTYKMPNRNDYLPMNSKVNNTMSNVVRNLKSEHGFSTKGASMRVYRDFESCFCQQNRNFEQILTARGV